WKEVFGNRLEDYIALIDDRASGTRRNGIKIGHMPPVFPANQTGEGESDDEFLDTESFFNVLKSVSRSTFLISNNVLDASPITALGPVGTILAPLAGLALHATSKLTESGFEDATESSIT